MNTALVTGGFGFIGSNLVHELVRRGVHVTVLDNLDTKCGGNRHNLAGLEDAIHTIEGDLRDAQRVREAVRGADVIFHCGARTSHSSSMLEPIEDVQVNCIGTLNLLESVRHEAPHSKVVHVGTSTQIGRATSSPVTETHAEFPLDIYSADKTASEKYVLIYGRSHGLRTTVIRLANNFGPRAAIRSSDYGFVNFFIGLGLQHREITVFGDGSQLRTMSYVDDSVAALLLAADDDRANSQVWFAVASEQVSVARIASAITEEIGGTVRYIPWPPERKAIEVGDAVISNAKLTSELGWAPRVELREGLRRTRAYFESQLEHYLQDQP